MSDATLLEGDDLRRFAEDELARHTPVNQERNGYNRCAECHYTRHPCDVYDLAAAVLRLLDREIIMTAGREPACPTCGVWHEGHYHHMHPLYAHDPETGLTTVVVQHDASFNEESNG